MNLTFSPRRWIQPDVTVLHALPKTDEEDRWIPAHLCTMAVEFVSPGSRRQDFVDKPVRCAEGRVPYFLRVELSRRPGHAQAELSTLGRFGGYDTVARAVGGFRSTCRSRSTSTPPTCCPEHAARVRQPVGALT
ncbi:hypothetical protein ACFHW0_28945 [Micromonospora sp. LOL_025]|uniref:hypothetical protein n=1 Tax=Micromonospora sp. LOL_025 TaxID=3345413 RepID=UPI003A8A5E70